MILGLTVRLRDPYKPGRIAVLYGTVGSPSDGPPIVMLRMRINNEIRQLFRHNSTYLEQFCGCMQNLSASFVPYAKYRPRTGTEGKHMPKERWRPYCIAGVSSSTKGIFGVRFLTSGTSNRYVTASCSGGMSVAALRHDPFEEALEENRKAAVAGGAKEGMRKTACLFLDPMFLVGVKTCDTAITRSR